MIFEQINYFTKIIRSGLVFILLSLAMPVLSGQVIMEKDSTASSLIPINFIAMPITQGRFNQRKFFKILNKPIKSSGELYFANKLGFLWQTNKPVFDQLLLKSDGLYHFDGINPATKMQGANVLAQVLMKAVSGNLAALNEEFTINNTTACLQLTPKDKGLANVIEVIELCHQPVTQSRVQSDDTSIEQRELSQIILRETSGNRTEIDVKLQAVEELPEAIRAQLQ